MKNIQKTLDKHESLIYSVISLVVIIVWFK